MPRRCSAEGDGQTPSASAEACTLPLLKCPEKIKSRREHVQGPAGGIDGRFRSHFDPECERKGFCCSLLSLGYAVRTRALGLRRASRQAALSSCSSLHIGTAPAFPANHWVFAALAPHHFFAQYLPALCDDVSPSVLICVLRTTLDGQCSKLIDKGPVSWFSVCMYMHQTGSK